MENNTITVRDRRKARQFSISNVVMDDWYPVIGPVGFGIYALLVRMANRNGEKAWPGYSLITKHLSISRSSTSAYITLLQYCGLIHVKQGGPRRSNTYYILEPDELTAEKLQEVSKKIANTWPETNSHRKTFEKRLQQWASLKARFSGTAVEQGTATAEPQGSTARPPSATGEPQSSTEVPEQSEMNMPEPTNRTEQAETVVVDGHSSLAVEFLENLARDMARVDHLSSAFDQAEIVGEATRRSIVAANPDITADDVKAWKAYQDNENLKRPDSCSTAVIIAMMRSRQRPPAHFYNSQTETITILE